MFFYIFAYFLTSFDRIRSDREEDFWTLIEKSLCMCLTIPAAETERERVRDRESERERDSGRESKRER